MAGDSSLNFSSVQFSDQSYKVTTQLRVSTYHYDNCRDDRSDLEDGSAREVDQSQLTPWNVLHGGMMEDFPVCEGPDYNSCGVTDCVDSGE